MAIQFATIVSPGGFFKPADHANAAAILIEPTRMENQKPTNYGPKDTVHANLTVFATAEDAKNGNGTEIIGSQIQQTLLARDLAPLVGQATVVKLVQQPSSKPGQHPAWVWRPADAAVTADVVAYATKREEDAAAALSSGAMPDFLS